MGMRAPGDGVGLSESDQLSRARGGIVLQLNCRVNGVIEDWRSRFGRLNCGFLFLALPLAFFAFACGGASHPFQAVELTDQRVHQKLRIPWPHCG